MKWIYKNSLACCMAILAADSGIAQNNAIYKGGSSDGWSQAAYKQNTLGIFKGGQGDGFNSGGFNQLTSNIFKGGAGDGWSNSNFIQSTVNIFKGGAADGWSNKSYEQSTPNIYKGGPGDGWASTYVPQRPLPVTFMYFTAQKKGNNGALIQWKTGTESNTAHFEVERSGDAVTFEYLGKVLATANASGTSYSFVDNHPLKGVNYYRLKQVDKDNVFTYTPARQLHFDATEHSSVRYYPNPTNGILNIEIPAEMHLQTIIINVSNASGAVVDQVKVDAGTSSVLQVPLNRYAKGIYFIQVKTATVSSTQRVVLQ